MRSKGITAEEDTDSFLTVEIAAVGETNEFEVRQEGGKVRSGAIRS
jgi:hypothetical protein